VEDQVLAYLPIIQEKKSVAFSSCRRMAVEWVPCSLLWQ